VAVGIDLDVSRAIQRPSERVDLVRAVVAAHPSDESEWIEWKTQLDLTKAEGRFHAARHVLGFANRTPHEAVRFVHGHGFLLIGAEPGNLVGASRRDPAQLEDWLRPYLGQDGPIWDAHYVDVDDVEVLLIDIAPPSRGDPIHTVRKAFNQWHEGYIFVRHKGKNRASNVCRHGGASNPACRWVSGRTQTASVSGDVGGRRSGCPVN
jgi:hypothetical protein